MLAGRMKLKYFVALLSVVGIAGIVLAVKGCKQDKPVPKPEEVAAKPAPDQPPPPRPAPPPDQPRPSLDSLHDRAHDAAVLAYKGKTLSGGKGKDVTKGKPYKVNVYQDAGKRSVNRAKVDLDRDDKWDEKWTFDGETITLELAPADDEQYTKTYHRSGSEWIAEGAAVAPAPPPDTAAKPDPNAKPTDLAARAWDNEVIGWKDRSIASDKEKDVSKGKTYKINVYKDAGHTSVNRAKVDINRNDKWDDKYTFEPGKITLQHAPADDEQYTETYHWTGSGWAKAK